MVFIEYCNQIKILLAVCHPHSTKTLQLLDVVMFKPLATTVVLEVIDYLSLVRKCVEIMRREVEGKADSYNSSQASTLSLS
jgi:hypothetical protein